MTPGDDLAGEWSRGFLVSGTSSERSRFTLSRLRLSVFSLMCKSRSDWAAVVEILLVLEPGCFFNLIDSSSIALSWIPDSVDVEWSSRRARTKIGSSSILTPIRFWAKAVVRKLKDAYSSFWLDFSFLWTYHAWQHLLNARSLWQGYESGLQKLKQ